MATITIPKSQQRAVQRLLSLSPEKMGQFIECIKTASPASSFRVLERRLQQKIDTPITGLNPILQMVATLGGIAEDEGMSNEEIAGELIGAAQKDKIDDINPSDNDWGRLKRDLAMLFAVSAPIALTRKAAMLTSEHEHVYCPDNSRIISDIRSIFPSGEIADPVGAVIVHLLKLAYHQDDDTKAFYVALDSEDVRMLRDLLDRAISKEDRIKKTMKTSGIQFVGGEQEANQ